MCDERTSKVIDGLLYTMNMIVFNPMTGETKDREALNEADKTTYDACLGAIALLAEQNKQLEAMQFLANTRSGVHSKIARFFREWSGDDEAGETIPFYAAELREILGWFTDYLTTRRKLDELQAEYWPHVLKLDEIETPYFAFIEDKGEPNLDPAVITKITEDRVYMSSPVGDHRFRRSEYGKGWRLWAGTSQPRDDRRRQVQWEQG